MLVQFVRCSTLADCLTLSGTGIAMYLDAPVTISTGTRRGMRRFEDRAHALVGFYGLICLGSRLICNGLFAS